MGSKRKSGKSYADVSELPLSTRVQKMTEAMLRKFGLNIPLPDQSSTTNSVQRRNEVRAGPRVGPGRLI